MTTVAPGPEIVAGDADVTEHFGRSVLRREDHRFLTGAARFTEDITPAGLLHAVFVRSPVAHADIVSVDIDLAERAEGVQAVFTAGNLGDELPSIPTDWILPVMDGIPTRWALARDRVRFVGEAVAVVIAETRAEAADAAELVEVGYAPLPAVTDQEAAVADDAPQLHEDYPGNRSYQWHLGRGDFEQAAATADVVLDLRLVNQRVAASSLEARAVVADFDPGTGRLSLSTGTQNVHLVRRNLSIAVGIPEHLVHVASNAVGGGFGAKLCLYPEDATLAVASRRLRRPVRWAETRSENFVGTSHGRDHVEHVSVAARSDGKIIGLRTETYANIGAYVSGMGAGIPAVFAMVVPGCYDIEHVSADVHGIFTNTTTTETYRGAGRPEAAYLIERTIDELAVRLDLDPAEIRRRNFVRDDQFPYENGCGFVHDSGAYEAGLDEALRMLDYEGARTAQARARAEGRLVGIGMASYMEFCGFGDAHLIQLVGFDRPSWEQAVVAVGRTGTIAVQVGIDSAGQGHETTIAQIVAGRLELPMDDVDIIQGDTDLAHYGTGTFNSRSVTSGGSAALLATDKVLAKARRLAAHLLEVDPADLEYSGGTFGVSGVPSGRTVTFAEVSEFAFRGIDLPEGDEPGLKEIGTFDPSNFTAPFGTHVAMVEVDRATGEISIDRYVAVDDAGNLVNPQIATGQVHGGIAQGIGQALQESITFGADGQPNATSYLQYAVPRAHQVPHLETGHTVTPSPENPLGAKGIGESGIIGPPPALVNAVLDALRPLGVTGIDMPMTAPRVWAAIQEARS